MKLLSFASVSLVLAALGVAAVDEPHVRGFYQQVENAKSIAILDDSDNGSDTFDCSSCSGSCTSIAGVVTCCKGSIINGKCYGETSSANKDDSDSDNEGDTSDSGESCSVINGVKKCCSGTLSIINGKIHCYDDTSDSMSASGNGDNCSTINGVTKCCSGAMSCINGNCKCSGEMSSAKGVNPMWMGMLLMTGILVQVY